MSNLAAILRQEIQRLSRRESRSLIAATKKASALHRRHIAMLKRQVATLERQVAQLRRGAADSKAEPAAADAALPRIRFVAKGLKSHRERLGLSAADFGRLVGVSAQSVYNWEQGHSSPRPRQLKAIATLRSAGKRAVQALLAEAAAPVAKRRVPRGKADPG